MEPRTSGSSWHYVFANSARPHAELRRAGLSPQREDAAALSDCRGSEAVPTQRCPGVLQHRFSVHLKVQLPPPLTTPTICNLDSKPHVVMPNISFCVCQTLWLIISWSQCKETCPPRLGLIKMPSLSAGGCGEWAASPSDGVSPSLPRKVSVGFGNRL